MIAQPARSVIAEPEARRALSFLTHWGNLHIPAINSGSIYVGAAELLYANVIVCASRTVGRGYHDSSAADCLNPKGLRDAWREVITAASLFC